MTTTTTTRRGSLARAEARQALGFASPALVGLALFTIVPVGLSIVMSVYDWPTFGDRTFNGVENYAKLFTSSPDFWPALRNSAVYTLLYVPLSIALSLALAIGLGPRIRGRGALRVLFFIPVVVPMSAEFGLVVVSIAAGFAAFAYYTGQRSVRRQYEVSAGSVG